MAENDIIIVSGRELDALRKALSQDGIHSLRMVKSGDQMKFKINSGTWDTGKGHLDPYSDNGFQRMKDMVADGISRNAIPEKTANGVQIIGGLAVFTNNLDRGHVDLSRLSYEWNEVESRWVPWFDVVLTHTFKGDETTGRTSQSDDRVTTIHPFDRTPA